jgi:hypothetical protein
MQYGRDGWQRKMKLAEIEIYWSFAIHSALTLSLGSAGPEKPDADGWYVTIGMLDGSGTRCVQEGENRHALF